MSTQLASVETSTDVDEPERDEHGLEKLMTVAEFAKAEGMSTKTAYAGFKYKGWPYYDDLGCMKVSRQDRITIREMSRRANEPAVETPPPNEPAAETPPPRLPRRRTPRRRRRADA